MPSRTTPLNRAGSGFTPTRVFQPTPAKADSEGWWISGRAAIFGTASQVFIDGRRAFQSFVTNCFVPDPTGRDIFATYGFETTGIVGRTRSKTLTVRQTTHGIDWQCLLPRCRDSENLLEMIKRGDVLESTVGYNVVDFRWEKNVRFITKAILSQIAIGAIGTGSDPGIGLVRLGRLDPELNTKLLSQRSMVRRLKEDWLTLDRKLQRLKAGRR